MTDGQFDKRIREILSEPEEQLSQEALDRIWNGVEPRLDAAQDRRGIVVLRRWLAAVSSVAAVAAVALAVVHSLPDGIPEDGTVVAEEIVSEAAGRDASEESHFCVGPVGKEIVAVKEALAAVEGPVSGVTEDDAAAAEETESTEDTMGAKGTEDTEIAENTERAGSASAERVIAEAAATDGVDWSDIDETNFEKDYVKKKAGRRRPFELSVGGNSFVGPQKSSGPVRLSSKGNRTPSGKEFVEGSNSDTYSLPISFGVGVKYSITKWLGVGVGLSYTLLNKKVTGTYYDADGWCCSAEMKNSQHYIGIPVDIYFSLFRTKQWNAYAAVGGAVEKCVRNRYTGIFDGESLFYTRNVGGVQTSVKAGLGIEYSPLDFLGIYIDPSIKYYFAANQPRSIRTAQPLAFGVEAGLRFKL